MTTPGVNIKNEDDLEANGVMYDQTETSPIYTNRPLCVSRSPLECDGSLSSRRNEFYNRLLIGMLTNGGMQA